MDEVPTTSRYSPCSASPLRDVPVVRSFVRYQQWNCRHPRRRFVQLPRPVHTQHTHTHTCTHTRSADGGPVSDLQGRLSKTSLAANLLTHTQTHTHIHTHTLSLPLSIIAHAARTINESSTVNKKGKNKKLCGALLTVEEVEVEVEVGEEEVVEEE